MVTVRFTTKRLGVQILKKTKFKKMHYKYIIYGMFSSKLYIRASGNYTPSITKFISDRRKDCKYFV